MFIIEALHWDQGSSAATPLNSSSGESHFNCWPPRASPEGRSDDDVDDVGDDGAGGDDVGGGAGGDGGDDAVVSNTNIEADADNRPGYSPGKMPHMFFFSCVHVLPDPPMNALMI